MAPSAGLAAVGHLSDKRHRDILTLANDSFWLANWPEAIEKVAQSRFCCGGGPNGWRATFDWFTDPDKDAVRKLVEGEYYDRPARKDFRRVTGRIYDGDAEGPGRHPFDGQIREGDRAAPFGPTKPHASNFAEVPAAGEPVVLADDPNLF
jgi:hypothetical protein